MGKWNQSASSRSNTLKSPKGTKNTSQTAELSTIPLTSLRVKQGKQDTESATMEQHERTLDQLREHYEIEKQLAQQLHNSTRQERKILYASLYDELFRRLPHHPQLTRKSSPEETVKKVTGETRHIHYYWSQYKDSIHVTILYQWQKQVTHC